MSKDSNIEWTGNTWPIVTGCDPDSDGCANCYAVLESWIHSHHPNPKISDVFAGTVRKSTNGKLQWTGQINLQPQRLKWILEWGNWKKPELVFVANLGDLFHKDVPFDFIDEAVAYMIIARWNIYQILTKRPEIMHQYFTSPDRLQKIQSALVKAKSEILETKLTKRVRKLVEESCRFLEETELKLPLDHLWLGYSVCTQKDAEDVYYLLKTPAKIRFLSCEPVLEDIDLSEYLSEFIGAGICDGCGEQRDILYAVDAAPVAGLAICNQCIPRLSWCILGGESGHNARVCEIEHLRSLTKACQKAQVRIFIKQLGAKPMLDNAPYKISDKKGGILSEFPEDLQIREFPLVNQ
ncbi:MAG: DUF5131 family protein [Dolichospermum sp. DET50]|nr:DUF5131 family protein [Dolichospermum sp. DET66]MBS3034335.1 DUF5131 family protein [Dolichospermum sp. DET67]MBS3039538.1 DUF5131 family protein [Dolichospermum sp. DET50]QSX66753.1 MAG: DUF5131 family protein [Dolichospermum sp. DET69]